MGVASPEVGLGVEDTFGIGLRVAVAEGDGVSVAVGIEVGVEDDVAVDVGITVGVAEGLAVGVNVIVDVGGVVGTEVAEPPQAVKMTTQQNTNAVLSDCSIQFLPVTPMTESP